MKVNGNGFGLEESKEVSGCGLSLEKLLDELVPEQGKAGSKAGEIVRAMALIVASNGRIGSGCDLAVCNPSARYLMANTTEEISNLLVAIWGLQNESAYKTLLSIIEEKVVEYVEDNPELRDSPTIDLFDYFDQYEDCTIDDYDFYDDYDFRDEIDIAPMSDAESIVRSILDID